MRHISREIVGGFVFGCILAGSVSLMAQTGGNADAKKMKNPVAADAKSIEAGKAIFAKNCSSCHGTAAKGDGAVVAYLKPGATKPSNLADATWDHGSTDGEIFTNIRDGIAPKFEMKGQKGKLMDNDMWNLVNFLHSLSPKK